MPTELARNREMTYRRIKPLAVELGISRKRLERFIKGGLNQLDLTIREHQALLSHPIFSETMEGLLLPLRICASPSPICPYVSQPPSMTKNESTENPSFEVKLKVELTNGAAHLETDQGEEGESLQLDLL